MENHLIRELARLEVATSVDLQRAMGISQSTLSRLIGRLDDRIVSMGRARSTRYALLRDLRSLGSVFQLFRVTRSGQIQKIGVLKSLVGGRWYGHDPITNTERLFDGLPYFLADARPQGFMGRAFPGQHTDLRLPERIIDWSDDDAMTAIARRGGDLIGNLIVGTESMYEHRNSLLWPIDAIQEQDCAMAYQRLCSSAISGDPAGSSAGGEQPKFAAAVTDGMSVRHVLVKFSPADDSPASVRWRDLLVAEHLAGVSLSRASQVPVADSRVIESGSRIFLEVTRFDRVGEHGRLGMISLGAMDDEHYGRRDNWLAAADRLQQDDRLTAGDAESLRIAYAFGGFIANSDRHFGNASMLVGNDGGLSLAPSYDQLPMLYAPTSGQLVDRLFSVDLPLLNPLLTGNTDLIEEDPWVRAWIKAMPLAQDFWQSVGKHTLVSPSFREIARENFTLLQARWQQALQWLGAISADGNSINVLQDHRSPGD